MRKTGLIGNLVLKLGSVQVLVNTEYLGSLEKGHPADIGGRINYGRSPSQFLWLALRVFCLFVFLTSFLVGEFR